MAYFFTYLLEASICLNILHLLYKHLLYKESYFEWNRIFFFAASAISLLIPFVHLPLYPETLPLQVQREWLMFSPRQGESLLLVSPQPENNAWAHWVNSHHYLTLQNLVWVVYLSGVFRVVIQTISSLFRIRRWLKQSPTKRQEGFVLVESRLDIPSFSFFSYIFLNKDFFQLSQSEKQQLLRHEKAHARQKHSFDILFFEMLRAVFWFNPLMKTLKNDVEEMHEFIADAIAVGKHSPQNYAYLVLKMANRKVNKILGSFFSKNQVKNRIQVLASPEPEKLRKLRFWVVLPLLLVVIMSFSFVRDVLKGKPNHRTTQEAQFVAPLKNNFSVLMPFFTQKKMKELNKKSGKNCKADRVLISHYEITYSTQSYSPVVACAKGTVAWIETIDNWGIMEKNICLHHTNDMQSIVKGLEKATVVKGQQVKQGAIIGFTGDSRFYPILGFQLLTNGKPVDPELYLSKKTAQ